MTFDQNGCCRRMHGENLSEMVRKASTMHKQEDKNVDIRTDRERPGITPLGS